MKLTMRKFMAFMVITLLANTAITGYAKADTAYPTKPITIIVPYGAGGSSDVGTRLVAKRLEKELGQPIVIENVPGASGFIGWQKMAKSKPDGYTLSSFNLAFIPGSLNPEVKRDIKLESVTPFVNHVWEVTAWAVKADSQFKDAKQLLSYIKDNPNKVSLGTSGSYTQHHIAVIALEKMGYKLKTVNCSGSAESVTMAMGGHIDLVSAGTGELKSAVNDGKLRILAVLNNKRSKFFPDTPTFLESTGVELNAFAARGFAGPANMDLTAVSRLEAAFKKVLEDPEHIEEMDKMGLEVHYLEAKPYIEFLKKYEADIKKTLGW
jgi:tripartite-type tricarboxylate transporter receptor subunit TctC